MRGGRSSYGGVRKPRLRPYRPGRGAPVGTAYTSARMFHFDPQVMGIGKYMGAVTVDLVVQDTAIDIQSRAPVSSQEHGPGTPRPWPHMIETIDPSLVVAGRTIYGQPTSQDDDTYGEVLVGFPIVFLEFGTTKMRARPLVGPAWDRTQKRLPSYMEAAARSTFP